MHGSPRECRRFYFTRVQTGVNGGSVRKFEYKQVWMGEVGENSDYPRPWMPRWTMQTPFSAVGSYRRFLSRRGLCLNIYFKKINLTLHMTQMERKKKKERASEVRRQGMSQPFRCEEMRTWVGPGRWVQDKHLKNQKWLSQGDKACYREGRGQS